MSYYTDQQVKDLKGAIGEEFSYNGSRTLRAKLIEVKKGYCIYEEVKSPYSTSTDIPREGQFKSPIWRMWNSLFY